MRSSWFLILLLAAAATASAQDKGSTTISLNDLSSFRPQAGNWMVVGDVSIDPTVDIHAPKTPPAEPTGKRKKKSRDAAPAPVLPEAVRYSSGTGILLNMNDETRKDHLVTTFEHGDIELELDVMLPRGSNSGIYLQGRYEVQLLDSWGVRNPGYGDIGGIYRNWETEPSKVYMGKAPLTNAAKAPGLWQKMKISFRAPRFDSSGKKIANARFVSVELNGVRIHDNVEVPLPTGGPLENNEVAKGPLMIQGDHGPVAFRNIRYRLMKDAPVTMSDVAYKTYYGKFTSTSDFAAATPAATGTMNELSCEVLEADNEYGITYTGKITVPEDAEYEFTIMFTGGAKVSIAGQELVNLQRGDAWFWDTRKLALKAGTHSFEINSFKDASWMPPRLGLFVRTENIHNKALHAFNSLPPDDSPVSPIYLSAGSQPRLLRAFIDFRGDRSQRLTHTIGVGDPSGINYIYDLRSGNLVCVWRGDFADATPMWHDRGDGSFSPAGAPQFIFRGQPLATVSGTEAFPVESSEKEFRGKGYTIDPATSRPVFHYVYRGMQVEDRIYPDDQNRMITHEVVVKDPAAAPGVQYKLAEGSSITKISDNLYAIGDREYYVRTSQGVTASIRDVNGVKELITPVSGTVKYSIIW